MTALTAPHLRPENLIMRLDWSPGTDAAEALGGAAIFERGARLATPPWRTGLGPCRSVRLVSSPTDAATTVAVVPVPDDLVRALRALASDEPGRNRGDRDRLVTAELKPFLRTMLLTVGWRLDGDEMHIGLTVGPIGLPHTTVNPSTERHVGLHFDSWDRLGPLDRDRGTNRLCVNLGIGARHLLFVPKAAAVVLQEFASKHLDVFTPEALQDSTGRFDLARRYLEAFPEQPVLRIRVLPGEAYVAPTENLIHDGSSEESIDRDISVTVRGFFVPLEARATV